MEVGKRTALSGKDRWKRRRPDTWLLISRRWMVVVPLKGVTFRAPGRDSEIGRDGSELDAALPVTCAEPVGWSSW